MYPTYRESVDWLSWNLTRIFVHVNCARDLIFTKVCRRFVYICLDAFSFAFQYYLTLQYTPMMGIKKFNTWNSCNIHELETLCKCTMKSRIYSYRCANESMSPKGHAILKKRIARSVKHGKNFINLSISCGSSKQAFLLAASIAHHNEFFSTLLCMNIHSKTSSGENGHILLFFHYIIVV